MQQQLDQSPNLVLRLRRLSEHTAFKMTVIAAIAAAGIIVGLQSMPTIVMRFGYWLTLADQLLLALFVFELVVKIGAEGKQPWRFFRSGWNVFDFAVVAACFLPQSGGFAAVLRLARVLRVLRLLHAVPRLQILVTALFKSIPSMGYVSLLLGLVFYVYAVVGTYLFASNDPVHFGSLGSSMLTLFRVVTLEGWSSVMYTQIYGCATFGYGMSQELCTQPNAQLIAGTLYFVTFVLLGTMILLNLFIGVIMASMEEARSERGELTTSAQLAAIAARLEQIDARTARLEARLQPTQDTSTRSAA